LLGELSIVLHTHMPYVEGYGTWPFGEEWLWEAIVTSYLPVLDVLDDHEVTVTMSMTPVLCDQLEAPGIDGRLYAFLETVRPRTHQLDIDSETDPGVQAELRRSAADYEAATARLREIGGCAGLLQRLGVHAAWTSSATHAILPLLATDTGVRLQLEAGIDAHRARFGVWHGGFWLPECAHATWLDHLLEQAGVHSTCVDLTDVLGRGSPDQLRPQATEAGPLLAPIDRELIELVWSDGGYPTAAAYRNHHGFTTHRHRAWANDGRPYDRERGAAQAREDGAAFAARVRERVRDGGLAVVALDTELLGHHWMEGPQWLAAVLEDCARNGPEVLPLDEAIVHHEPAPPRELPTTTWGAPRTLATWSGPAVADIAWTARDAELRLVADHERAADPGTVRELLALQSSDWAFLVGHDLAVDYGRQRARQHAAALTADPPIAPPRNLAAHARPAVLLT
jgi:1,4-alpha-glucan branching enzyme